MVPLGPESGHPSCRLDRPIEEVSTMRRLTKSPSFAGGSSGDCEADPTHIATTTAAQAQKYPSLMSKRDIIKLFSLPKSAKKKRLLSLLKVRALQTYS